MKERVRYHGSWTHRSEKADSQHSGRNACRVGHNRANLHTPVLPARTAAELETERGGLINGLPNGKKPPKIRPQVCLRCTETQTYGSCTRPPPQDSRPRCRSAVWTARSCCPNTGTVQLDSQPAGGRCPGPGPDKPLRLTCQRSPARRHTASSLGGTESSTHTGTGPRHRSEAGE